MILVRPDLYVVGPEGLNQRIKIIVPCNQLAVRGTIMCPAIDFKRNASESPLRIEII